MLFNGGYTQSVTHQPTLIVNPFLTLQHVTMNVGNHCTGVCEIALNLGNDSVCLRDHGRRKLFHAHFSAPEAVILRVH
jgi:hypothetical protein